MKKESETGQYPSKVVNDFCMTVCTVNGSGSATANTTLLRAMFHMGIPVSGKYIPLQHQRSAHLVFHPCIKGWLPGPGGA